MLIPKHIALGGVDLGHIDRLVDSLWTGFVYYRSNISRNTEAGEKDLLRRRRILGVSGNSRLLSGSRRLS
jgi:hypothetical protein